jgi:hypothetical protein
MSEGYARNAPQTTGIGFLLVAVPSVVAAFLLVLAFIYATGSSARIASENRSAYTAVADPANQALTPEVSAYARDQRDDLAAAKADLIREMKTEASFDNQLSALTFQSLAENNIAAALIQADGKRAKLIGLQVKSTSLRELQSFDSRDQAATAAVEAQVASLRSALGLPASSG